MATASWMPADEDLRPHAEALAAVAGVAPSLHNAQPWRFRVGHDHVDVLLDRSRLLPVVDPKTRQAHLGLGAAVFLLRLALSTMDRAVEAVSWPDSGQPDLVARLAVGGRHAATDEDRQLLAALPARRTVRTPFTTDTVPVGLQVAWRDLTEAEGAELRWVAAPGERVGVSALVTAAERLQQRDPAYLAELDRWTAAGHLDEGAGVPPEAFGVSAAVGHVAEFPLRDFAGGARTIPPRPTTPLEQHPVVTVLHTPADRPEDWLRGRPGPHAAAALGGRRGIRRLVPQPAARAARPAPATTRRAPPRRLAPADPPARPTGRSAASARAAPAGRRALDLDRLRHHRISPVRSSGR